MEGAGAACACMEGMQGSLFRALSPKHPPLLCSSRSASLASSLSGLSPLTHNRRRCICRRGEYLARDSTVKRAADTIARLCRTPAALPAFAHPGSDGSAHYAIAPVSEVSLARCRTASAIAQ